MRVNQDTRILEFQEECDVVRSPHTRPIEIILLAETQRKRAYNAAVHFHPGVP